MSTTKRGDLVLMKEKVYVSQYNLLFVLGNGGDPSSNLGRGVKIFEI